MINKTNSSDSVAGLAQLIWEIRPSLNNFSKAKAAKIVRHLVNLFLDMENKTGHEVSLCFDCIEWDKQEKRSLLRQSLEARLISLYYDTKMYTESLQLASTLLKDLKKLDDKNLTAGPIVPKLGAVTGESYKTGNLLSDSKSTKYFLLYGPSKLT